jgi:hypothetical protein
MSKGALGAGLKGAQIRRLRRPSTGDGKGFLRSFDMDALKRTLRDVVA